MNGLILAAECGKGCVMPPWLIIQFIFGKGDERIRSIIVWIARGSENYRK